MLLPSSPLLTHLVLPYPGPCALYARADTQLRSGIGRYVTWLLHGIEQPLVYIVLLPDLFHNLAVSALSGGQFGPSDSLGSRIKAGSDRIAHERAN